MKAAPTCTHTHTHRRRAARRKAREMERAAAFPAATTLPAEALSYSPCGGVEAAVCDSNPPSEGDARTPACL